MSTAWFSLIGRAGAGRMLKWGCLMIGGRRAARQKTGVR